MNVYRKSYNIYLYKLFAESSITYNMIYLTMPALQHLKQVKPVRYIICLG